MGLIKTGRTNKTENILRAYDFVNKAVFPTSTPTPVTPCFLP